MSVAAAGPRVLYRAGIGVLKRDRKNMVQNCTGASTRDSSRVPPSASRVMCAGAGIDPAGAGGRLILNMIRDRMAGAWQGHTGFKLDRTSRDRLGALYGAE